MEKKLYTSYQNAIKEKRLILEVYYDKTIDSKQKKNDVSLETVFNIYIYIYIYVYIYMYMYIYIIFI